ncbi:MAG: hypothetical protein HUU46_20915 [Candidatus Hydrogenedentes bacterium]|nr:hypothetical protein [Candidatus Hydrogenedentota bacterium]
MRDNLSVRIGGIAANLSRIYSFSQDIGSCEEVLDLINETIHFVNWTMIDPTIECSTSHVLADLAALLETWKRTCQSNWVDDTERLVISSAAQEWAQRILQCSGLLNRAKPA